MAFSQLHPREVLLAGNTDARPEGDFERVVMLALRRPWARIHLADVWSRRACPSLAAAFALWIWEQQLNLGLVLLPACRTCGQPSGCSCEGCGFPRCCECDDTPLLCHKCSA